MSLSRLDSCIRKFKNHNMISFPYHDRSTLNGENTDYRNRWQNHRNSNNI